MTERQPPVEAEGLWGRVAFGPVLALLGAPDRAVHFQAVRVPDRVGGADAVTKWAQSAARTADVQGGEV